MDEFGHFGSEVATGRVLADHARRTPNSHITGASGAPQVYATKTRGATPVGGWHTSLCRLSFRKGELVSHKGAEGDPWHGRTVRVRLDATDADRKPENAGAVSARIMKSSARVEATVPELVQALSLGWSVLPGVCEGRRTPGCWESQELFMVDVDNDAAMAGRGWSPLGYDEAVERAFRYGLPLALGYRTFGSSPDPDAPAGEQRFRLGFLAPRKVEDAGEARRFAEGMRAAFPEADRSTSELNRIFFGTDKEVDVWGRL